MKATLTIGHSDTVSGMTFFNTGQIALWSEGPGSVVNLITPHEWDSTRLAQKPTTIEDVPGHIPSPLMTALDEGFAVGHEMREMTDTEEKLYDALRAMNWGTK